MDEQTQTPEKNEQNAKTTKKEGGCPYAFPSCNSSVASSAPPSPQMTPLEAVEMAKKSCPAFKEGSCPFRNVQDADSMRLALQTLPPSHFSTNRTTQIQQGAPNASDEIGESLKIALTHVHTISSTLQNDQLSSNHSTTSGENTPHTRSRSSSYIISGGCPFKTQYGNDTTFVNAMEEFSLFGLMGKILEESLHSSPIDVQPTTVGNNVAKPMKRVRSTTSLSSSLKIGTQDSHSAAESVHFVKEFIKGNIDKTLYTILIQNLLVVYEQLEELLEQHAPNHFPSLHFPKELSRVEALREDVDFFKGQVQSYKISQATQDYVRRLKHISESEPLLLLSHAYTRYLGDLSGGKILARVAKRAMNLQGSDAGLAFYQFDNIPSAKLFKDSYRQALDDLELTDEQVERLVAEANVAFVLNMRIFEELDVLNGIDGAFVREYESATVYFENCVKKQASRIGNTDQDNDDTTEKKYEDASKCPFAALGGPNPHKMMATPAKVEPSQDEKEPILENKELKFNDTVTQPSQQTAGSKNERCPWPFIFFHDPQTGLRDFQTWIVFGLLLCYIWNKVEDRIPLA